MSDAALRRPLFLLLLVYMGALAWLRSAGFFDPACAVNGRPGVRLLALADGPMKEDLRGWKGELQADGLRVEVRWPGGSALEELPLPGDLVVVDGRLRAPRPPRNFGDFDEAAFLADRGVAAVLEAESFEALPGAAPARLLLARWGERLRRSVHARLFAALPPVEARVAEGLLLGYKGALPRDLARAVRDAGLIHLLVPSGAKVAVALLLAAWLTGLMRLPSGGAWLLAAALGGAVALAAGGEPPYARAYLAGVALLAARAAGRESDAFQALAASAWLILLARPRALFSAGFQMSYLALFYILAFWPAVRRLPRWAGAFAVSLAVQAALWPLFANDFGRASLIGAIANVAALPAYPVLAGAGWLAWAGSFVGARSPAAGAAWLLRGFEVFCERAAGLPFAAVGLSPWAWTTVAGYYAGLLALPRLWARRGLLLIAGSLVFGGIAWRRVTAPPVRVITLNVPRRGGKRRFAALVQYNGGETTLLGEAPPALARKAELALGVSPDRAAPHLYPIRLGNAKISLLKSSAQEVETDGVEVHVGIPR